MPEDISEKSWIVNFCKKQGGFCPTNIDKWIEDVDKNHTYIKECLNGSFKDYQLETELSPQEGDMDQTLVKKITELIELLPDYLRTFNLAKNDLYSPKLLIKNNQVSTTKHISSFVNRKKGEIPDYCKNKISKILSEIGVLFPQELPKVTRHFRLSIQPKIFAQIGNFPCDQGSCFRQGANYNEYKKYLFSTSPSTFVLLGADDAGFKKFKSRMLGWVSLSKNAINFCSPYPYLDYANSMATFTSERGILLKRIARDFLKEGKISYKSGIAIIRGECYGHNPSFSYSNKNDFSEKETIIVVKS